MYGFYRALVIVNSYDRYWGQSYDHGNTTFVTYS